jgi:periodic tryptophan protein 2
MSSYTFANVCGAPFEGGQITFDKTGNCLLVPSSNRVTVYDLRQNRVQTLPFEARHNIQYILCSSIMNIVITIDVLGRALVVNSTNSVVLSRFSFSHPISAAKFSPCGRYLATASQKAIKFWDVPTMENRWFCSLRRKIQHHADTIVSVCWSCNSEYVCTSSKDLTVRIFSLNPKEGFKVLTFVEHRFVYLTQHFVFLMTYIFFFFDRSPLRGAFFSQDMKYVISVATDGTMISWKWMTDAMKHEEDELLGMSTENRAFSLQNGSRNSLARDHETNIHRDLRKKCLMEDPETKENKNSENSNLLPDYSKGSWKMECKIFCNLSGGALVSHVAYNSLISLLATGFSNGLICLYSTPDFATLYTLSIGNSPLDSLEITSDGEWLGIGNSYAGQVCERKEIFFFFRSKHK